MGNTNTNCKDCSTSRYMERSNKCHSCENGINCNLCDYCIDCTSCTNCISCKYAINCNTCQGILFSNKLSYYSTKQLENFILKNINLCKIYLDEIIDVFYYDILDHKNINPYITYWNYESVENKKYLVLHYKSIIKNEKIKIPIDKILLIYKFFINYEDVIEFLINGKKFPKNLLPRF